MRMLLLGGMVEDAGVRVPVSRGLCEYVVHVNTADIWVREEQLQAFVRVESAIEGIQTST